MSQPLSFNYTYLPTGLLEITEKKHRIPIAVLIFSKQSKPTYKEFQYSTN